MAVERENGKLFHFRFFLLLNAQEELYSEEKVIIPFKRKTKEREKGIQRQLWEKGVYIQSI